MTDGELRTRGQEVHHTSTMASSDEDGSFTCMDHFTEVAGGKNRRVLSGHTMSSQSSKVKGKFVMVENKDGHNTAGGLGGGVDGKSSENTIQEGVYETCSCRKVRYDIFGETSSVDSVSGDSQSVLADNEIDNIFEDIFIGNSSTYLNMSLSSSEEDFDNDELHDISSNLDDSDWDIFDNRSNQDEWSVAIIGSLSDFEAVSMRTFRRRGETEEVPPLYPHRAMMYHECEVCLSRTLMRRRVCCDFHICAECMAIYVSGKVSEAKVQIECPNDHCNVLIHRDEVNERLPTEMKDKFAKFLVNANADPLKKTCPACSEVYSIEPKMLSMKKKKLKQGLKVRCPQCNLHWCFQCQAPFHTDITCKQHQKGDKMVKKWAKELSAGQSNAQKCPKCKIFIQKVNGCDHMKCSKCNTDFCYRCGDRYISIKLLGNHWSKFSLFGCKYRLMPKRPALRKLIRGANFAARLVAGVALAGLGIAAGAILVGASVVIVPGYGIFRLRRHLQMKEKRKRAEIKKEVERHFSRVFMVDFQGQGRPNGETEAENPDARQVQVMVHRSVSFTHEDAESVQSPQDEDFEFFINKYTAEGTDMVVSGKSNGDSDQVIVLSDVTEVQNIGGYPTVVAQIVSKLAPDKETSAKSKSSSRNRNDDNSNQSNAQLNPLENFLGKSDPQVNVCDANDAMPKEESLAECCLRKNTSLTADVPSCSWENLSDNRRVDSGYGEDESYHEIPTSETKSGNVVSGDDTDSTKRGNNGCFGNIFSRRVQVPLTNSESPTLKSQTSSSQKKIFYRKAATWEKCNRSHVQSLLKSSPLDPVNDFKNLTLIMQKSPVSSVDIADMFNDDIRSFKNNFSNIKQGENIPESFIPDKELLDGVHPHLCTSTDGSGKIKDQSTSGHDNHHPCDESLVKTSNNAPSLSCYSTEDFHVSLFSEDTHL